MSDAATAAARRGRPRDARVDEAVIEAFVDLVSEQGFAATSMDQVAERAGVAKTTIYRRWPSRDALILDTHRALRLPVAPADTGSLEGDLRAQLTGIYAAMADSRVSRFMQAWLGELVANEELANLFRAEIVAERVEQGSEVFRRAVARGEIPVDMDCAVYVHLMAGSTVFRTLFLGETPEPASVERYVRPILDAIEAESRRRDLTPVRLRG